MQAGSHVIAGVSCAANRSWSLASQGRGMSVGLALRLPFQRIRIDQTPPAFAVEGRPTALRLSEPVGYGVKRRWMRPKAEVA